MNFILKHYDTPLIGFSLENAGLKGNVCYVLWTDDSRKDLLPIGLNVNPAGMLSWLRTRTVPKNREYVEAILASMHLAENDLQGILTASMGLSLNDCYWTVPEGFNGIFEDYNLYDNDFKKALSLIAYSGFGSLKSEGFTSSPEFTTNGMLRKGWRRLGGRIFLYKGGTEGAANTGNEPWSEYYASQLARAMDINAVTYTLSRWKNSVCSVCELFTDRNFSYVPIWRFGSFSSVIDVSEFMKKKGREYYDEFCDMMIFDALIYNTDRHQGNFGLMVDSHKNKPVSMAPVFDNGLGLFPYAMKDDFDNLPAYAKTRSSAFDVSFDDIAAEYMTVRQRRKLSKLSDFKFVSDKNYNLPVWRIRALEKFIRFRAEQLLKK